MSQSLTDSRGGGLHSRTIEVLDQRGIGGIALNDIFVLDGQDEWRARIESSVTDPGALRDRADAVRAHIVAQNPLARAAEAWRKILAADV